MAWMSNAIPQFYVHMITYPYPKFNFDIISAIKKT